MAIKSDDHGRPLNEYASWATGGGARAYPSLAKWVKSGILDESMT